MKLGCECGECHREHEYFEEFIALVDALGGTDKFAETNLIILLKDCREIDFLAVAETDHLKMGHRITESVDMEIVVEEFMPLSKTIWN